ncbi:type II toxin-antitoxin system HigB family toxin [Deinococcus cellulosilyticus]|uniref:Type II toxin-antitoxin system HigB family toxin n=1 Tax=Deinococcus cellulosilyticus (strain DSM 18568 / NBRC 106333 / KACC 11606 / 5516J-15) TaxID=1223518 RepID=A0A511NBB8_DEIC1|nr:type II toxin-antitoxin system HigB family toxin [Deinococcus cellulosilyticus]GEM50115.1 hypothetical protein DC3_57500 [Deinococcus cellulosilyticus NBRC 106333 = KACC 11606]
MNVVSKHKLREFWAIHPEAEQALTEWYNRLRKSTPFNFAQLKDLFNAADFDTPHTIFDVGGNKYRVIAIIDYTGQFTKIRHVFTHKEYDIWSEKKRKGKVED